MTDPIRSDEVEAKKVQWLWRERIPMAMLTVVAGRPDQGKGLFAAHVAADASRRGKNVLYSAAEDSNELMTRPRLEAAGARLDRIHLWRFQLPKQFDALDHVVRTKKIDLVVIDPLAAHLGSGISRHSDNIREVLTPVTQLLEETNAAMLIVEHALKRIAATSHPLNAIGGSGSGLPAATRAAYVFGVDPKDEDKRVLACVKCNLRELPKAIAFETDVAEMDKVGEVPFLLCHGEMSSFDPMSLFHGYKQGITGRPPDKRAAAAEWLTNYLAAANKPVPSGKILEDAKQYRMALKTLRRAADDMQIVKNPPGGGRNCTWDLPHEVKDLLGLLPKPAPTAMPQRADDGSTDWDEELSDLLRPDEKEDEE
jgi:hypothetical protein